MSCPDDKFKQGEHSIKGRIMALDVGTKTCGVAVTDPLGLICQPLVTLRYKGEHDQKRVFAELTGLFKDQAPQAVVVGLPCHRDGVESEQAKKVRAFIEGFKHHLGKNGVSPKLFEWVFFDEYGTTQAADGFFADVQVKRARRDRVIDKMAAVMLLKAYLEELAPISD